MANIDKVDLEKRIDRYLEQEIPLSYLMEEMDLSPQQKRLLVNRALSYNRKIENLNNNYPNASYSNVSQDFIAIPHEVDEEYPFAGDEQIALFKRLEELQNTIPEITRELIKSLDYEIASCEKTLQEFNPDAIKKGEKVSQELESMQINDDSIEDILQRNFLTPQDFMRLDKVFTSYLETRQKYEALCENRKEATSEYAKAKKMQREIEEIRENLLTHNVKLVNFCMRYFFSGIPVDQEEMQLYGLEGLVKAINGFDPNKGFQFSTYAVPTIVHTIQRNFKSLYEGYTWHDYCRKEAISYYRNLYRQEAGDENLDISPRSLASTGLISLTAREIANNDELIDRIAPLSDVQNPYEDEEEYGKRKFPATQEEYDSIDQYIDETEIGLSTLESDFIKKHIQDVLPLILSELKPNYAQALILRFGLEDGVFKTYEEVGKIIHRSRGRVRELVVRGLRELRRPVRYRKVKGLLELLGEIEYSENISELSPTEKPKIY